MLDAMCARCIAEGRIQATRSPSGRARYGQDGQAVTTVNGTALCAEHATAELVDTEAAAVPPTPPTPPGKGK